MFIFIGLLISGCSTQSPISKITDSYQEICGRDIGSDASERYPIYRVRVPNEWKRVDPIQNESITDTTKSLCEFIIDGDYDKHIRITVHNFPVDNADQRIPPIAQITRWKRQFTTIDQTSLQVIPQAFAGFSGLLLEATGIVKNEEISLIGWAMQIAPEHYSTLTASMGRPTDPILHKNSDIKQMRAEYTIKATGPKDLMAIHRMTIINFARSFELIEEIPSS